MKRGVRLGRPPKLTVDQVALGRRLTGEGQSVREVAKVLNCHISTLYLALDMLLPNHDPVLAVAEISLSGARSDAAEAVPS